MTAQARREPATKVPEREAASRAASLVRSEPDTADEAVEADAEAETTVG